MVARSWGCREEPTKGQEGIWQVIELLCPLMVVAVTHLYICAGTSRTLFAVMEELYFNKSNSLQEKRQCIYGRPALQVIYLPTRALASERVLSGSLHTCRCCGEPLLFSKCRDPAGFCKGVKGGGLGLGDLCWSLPAGDVFSAGFPTPWHTKLPLRENGFYSGVCTLAGWQPWDRPRCVIARF